MYLRWRPSLAQLPLVGLVLATGCGGGDGGNATDAAVDPGPPNMRTIGTQGGEVKLPGGEATLYVPPGAVDEPFAFSIVPSTIRADAFDITPAGLEFRIPATLSLTAPAQEGLYVGVVAGPVPVPLESRRDAGGRLVADVTHLAARYAIVPATPLPTREQAAEMVRAGLLPTIFNPASVVVGPMRMLAANEMIEDVDAPIAFDANVHETTGMGTVKLPRRTFAVPADRWFFWLDAMPTALFNHPTTWLLIDPARGTVQQVSGHSHPRVGAEVLPLSLEDRLRSPLTIAPLTSDPDRDLVAPLTSRVPLSAPTTQPQTTGGAPMCCAGTKVLIIRTSDETAFVDSETALKTYLTNTTPGASLDFTSITTVRPYDGDGIGAALDALILPPGQCWCDVLIYIVSHGDAGAFVIHPAASAPKTEEKPQYAHSALVEKLGKICARKLSVVVESCQAGTIHSIIDENRMKLQKAVPGGGLERTLRPYKCLNATISTAAAKGKSAFRGVAKLGVLFGAPYPMNFTAQWIAELEKSWYKDMPRDWSGAGANVVKGAHPGKAFLWWSTPESKTYAPGEDCCQCCGAVDAGTGVQPGGDDAGTSTGNMPTFTVSPIQARFVQAQFSTIYTVSATNPQNEPLVTTFSGPNCGTYAPQGASPPGTVANPSFMMTWMHPHPPCDATTQHADAIITAKITGFSGGYECTYQGAETGAGPPCVRLP